MEYDDIKDLIKTVVNTDIMCFELDYNGVDIKIDRNKKVYENKEVNNIKDVSEVENFNNEDIVKTKENYESDIKDIIQSVDDKNKSNNNVLAPIVGTFHSSSSPYEEPFVKIGSKVKKGDVLCIIEAMKVINEITSDFDGEVVDILVNDGELVEYDQKIIIIG